jgi:hypothetical protein
MSQRDFFTGDNSEPVSDASHILAEKRDVFEGPTSRPTPRLMTPLRETTLLGIRKTLNGVGFIVVYFEDCIQFGDLQ